MPSVCIDPSSLSLITPHYPSTIPRRLFLYYCISDRWNNEVQSAAPCGRRDITADGRDPTVSKGWKLSLLHLFYFHTSFPVGGWIFV